MKRAAPESESASDLIDQKIAALGDWRGETLARLRALIQEADPDIVEEWKWGTPVWSHDGIVCTGETYKSHVKLTFAKGAALADPQGVFNSSLEGNVRRAVDVHEGGQVDAPALKALIRAAAAFNASGKKTAPKKPAREKAAPKKPAREKAAPNKPAATRATKAKAPSTKSAPKSAKSR